MKIKTIKTNGRLVMSEICFSEMCEATVANFDNKKCGRIYLPRSWIDKNVYVIIKEGG